MTDPTTPAQAAAAFVEYVRSLNSDRAMFRDWLGGTPTGGPNDDGRYPLSDFTGNSFLVACPALLAAIGGNLATSIAALSAADPTKVGDDVEVIGTPTAGAPPARIPLFEIVNRKTADLNVLKDSEYAEWVSCLSSTGLERKLAVSALTRVVGAVIDPTQPPYNVKYDMQKNKPGGAFKNNNVIQASDPGVFNARDIGKLIAVSNVGDNGGPVKAYIGAVDPTGQYVNIFRDGALTQPYIVTIPGGNDARGELEFIWGTDCTAGMQRALDDAEPNGPYAYGKIVLLGGVCGVTSLQFGSIGIVGLGSLQCGFMSLPTGGTGVPMLYDKSGGAPYDRYKPSSYTLKGFQLIGQAYTTGDYRRNIDIRGGEFDDFVEGAPYASIDDLRSNGASWDGGAFNGAFAGDFSNANFGSNGGCGMRIGFWDLNGQNWHCEANSHAGVFSYMPGCNVNGVRCSYNGTGAGTAYRDRVDGSGARIDYTQEMGANWCENGYGNTVTNFRLQESQVGNIVFTGYDPMVPFNADKTARVTNGQKANFSFGTLDDTGDILPVHGGDASALPGVRSMVYLRGGSVQNNRVRFLQGSGQVKATNYATNGYYDAENPSFNTIDIETPGITNAAADWYDGGPSPATARGPFGTISASSIATRGNVVTVNGQAAP